MSDRSIVRTLLRRISVGLAAGVLAGWLALGANRGWTKTTVTRWQKDPVTDIEGPVIEKRFVPGVDLLAVGLAGALALFIVSLFANKTDQSKTS